MTLRIGTIVRRTEAEGPGIRFAVWVQGCSIRCDGCFNPHLWGTHGGKVIDVGEVAATAIEAQASLGVEGITLLGGEPFEQAEAAGALAEEVRSAGLSVMTFTGYTLEHLRTKDAPAGTARLLEATDLLVDGPYLADQRDLQRPWVGSRNQRFHCLSARYRAAIAAIEQIPDRIEVRIASTGQMTVNGWAAVDQLDALLAGTVAPIGRGSVR